MLPFCLDGLRHIEAELLGAHEELLVFLSIRPIPGTGDRAPLDLSPIALRFCYWSARSCGQIEYQGHFGCQSPILLAIDRASE